MTDQNTQTAGSEVIAADLNTVESLLEDLDLGAPLEEVIEGEEPVLEADAVSDEELGELAADITRAEAYENMEGGATPDEEGVAKAAEQKANGKPAKKAKSTTPKSTTPRTPKDLSSVAAEFFVLTGDVSAMDAAALETNKAAVLTKQPGQKKIAEKFENLFTSLSVGKAPSTYVMAAFKLLDDKKTMSSAELVAAYQASGLKEGTARSQTGQIMALFDIIGIAKRTNQSLTINSDSVVADRIRKLAA